MPAACYIAVMRFPIPVLLLLTAAAPCADFSPGGELPIATSRGPILCNRGFAVQEDSARREPVWSAEHLTDETVEAAQAMTGRAHFYPDWRIPSGERADLEDYRASGWSRGHLAPSGDMPDRASRAETFALSNIVPQDAGLNSGAWDRLEMSVRSLTARDGDVYVVTGPAFREDRGTIGHDHLRVPSSTWKAVYDPAQGAVAVIVCKNAPKGPCDSVGYDALVRVTGVDPFPGVNSKERGTRLSVKVP